jgi:predicted nucleic acid-binding protein
VADRKVVLDTSAVITLLCDEDGADVVEGYLTKAKKGTLHIYMSFATMAEVFSSATKKEGRDRAELYAALIKSWSATWVQSSEELCLSAGALRSKYKMSFADSFIAATAIHYDALLVHKDPEFETLKGILQMEILPYKNR